MSDKRANVLAQEAFGEVVNSGNLDGFDDLVAVDSVDDGPAPGLVLGPPGYRDLFVELRAAFPDLHVEVGRVTVTDDDVAFADTIIGTNDGSFRGTAATGHVIKVRGLQIGRFVAGQLVERWGGSDQLGSMTQLGLVAV